MINKVYFSICPFSRFNVHREIWRWDNARKGKRRVLGDTERYFFIISFHAWSPSTACLRACVRPSVGLILCSPTCPTACVLSDDDDELMLNVLRCHLTY